MPMVESCYRTIPPAASVVPTVRPGILHRVTQPSQPPTNPGTVHKPKSVELTWRVWLLGTLGAAAITAGGGAIGHALSQNDGTSAANPPTISFSDQQPGDGAHVDRLVPILSGSVSDLQPGQMVWTFNASMSNPTLLYPNLGPCPVDGNTWTCNDIYLGQDKDYCTQFILWAVVVTDEQGYQNALTRESTSHSMTVAQPPHVSNAIAKIVVTRKPRPGSNSC